MAMVRRLPTGTTALAFVLLTAGCTSYVWIEEEVPPPFDHRFINTVAVPEFANRTPDADAGRIVADRVEEILVNESPYKVVTRMELGRIMDEHKLSLDGTLDSEAINRLGRIGGVDALVLGTVEAWDYEEKKDWSKTRTTVKATVAVALKLVNSTTGLVVWSRSSQGRYSRERTVFSLSKPLGRRECFEKAMDEALVDVRSTFPRKKKVRARAEEAP